MSGGSFAAVCFARGQVARRVRSNLTHRGPSARTSVGRGPLGSPRDECPGRDRSARDLALGTQSHLGYSFDGSGRPDRSGTCGPPSQSSGREPSYPRDAQPTARWVAHLVGRTAPRLREATLMSGSPSAPRRSRAWTVQQIRFDRSVLPGAPPKRREPRRRCLLETGQLHGQHGIDAGNLMSPRSIGPTRRRVKACHPAPAMTGNVTGGLTPRLPG